MIRMNKLFKNMKNYIHQAVQSRRRPGEILADIIYLIYKCNNDNIPYPLLLYVINYYGGWAGVSIYLNSRKYLYHIKVTKAKNLFTNLIIPSGIILVVIFGAIQKSDTFFFGFVQNLLSDIILILLIIYLLPKILNPQKKYNVSLMQFRDIIPAADNDKVEIIISLVNTGEEVYKREEIYWEIFIPFEYLEEEDISLFNGEIQIDEFFGKMWKIFGTNLSPLFIKQDQRILRANFNRDVLYGTTDSPLKIYYEFKTINGNIPTIENTTRDFMGYGIPIEEYPKWAELKFTDWHDPNRFSTVENHNPI